MIRDTISDMKHVTAISNFVALVSILVAGCASTPIATGNGVDCVNRPISERRALCYDYGYRVFGKDW